MNESEIDVGGITLAVTQSGAGGTPLLLLHGFTGAKEDFADWLDAFASAGFHVVAPDHRGHGSSGQPQNEAAYSLKHMADDALGLADALGWDRFALLGLSMGGVVAQHVALAAPERLLALVLMDTWHASVEGIDPDLLDLAIDVVRTKGMDELCERQKEHTSPLSTPADQRVRAERPGYVEFADRKLRACAAAMYPPIATEVTHAPDRLDALAALDVPTLVLVGEQDAPMLGPSRRMAEAMPGARLAIIADAGHSPQFEAPERWWDEVCEFLSEHQP